MGMMPRFDLRKQRAMSLAAHIMQELRPYIDDREQGRAHDALLRLLYTEGVEVLTDHTRNEAGLPPRSGDGWTYDEIRALEQRRLEVMFNPNPGPIFVKHD